MTASGSPPGRTVVAGQAAIGIGLAVLIVALWTGLHVFGVFFYPWSSIGVLLAPLLVAMLCWLNVGLFIIAHDAMHGSLAPFRPGVNRVFGRLSLLFYAGFSYDRLLPKHLAHHSRPGTVEDPDFFAPAPDRFRPWFAAFIRRYFGWREFATLSVLFWTYLLLLGASPVRLLAFWALPAILSAVQLFYFGTYRPHRSETEEFADRHRARSSDYSWPVSLLTCFHFGMHHEHHVMPWVPWWRLPSQRKRLRSADASTNPAAAGAP
ncbi:MAG: fatty acid desaturase [Alphaproteobacteria bacterium]